MHYLRRLLLQNTEDEADNLGRLGVIALRVRVLAAEKISTF